MEMKEYGIFSDTYNKFLDDCKRVLKGKCHIYVETRSGDYAKFANFYYDTCGYGDNDTDRPQFLVSYMCKSYVCLTHGDGKHITLSAYEISLDHNELNVYVMQKIKEEKSRIEERELHKKQQEEAKERAEYERLKKKFG